MSKLYYPKSTYVITRVTIKGEKMIQKRNIVAVYLLSIITLGIYGIYWEVKTKDEINVSVAIFLPLGYLSCRLLISIGYTSMPIASRIR